MAVYCVTYDLKSPGQNYDAIDEYLEQFDHCKELESFWLIQSDKKASEIRDELSSLADSNDIIFVARLYKEWGSYRYHCSDWLKKQDFSDSYRF